MELDITLHDNANVMEAPIVFADGQTADGMDPFAFPYGTELCLGPILDMVRDLVDAKDAGIRFLAREVARLAEDAPELCQPVQDLSLLNKHKDLLDMLMLFLVPPSDRETEFFKFSKPFHFTPIYLSKAMKELMASQNACYSFGGQLDLVRNRHLVFIGCFILQRFYGVEVDMTPSAMLTVKDTQNGLERFYKPVMDQKYIKVVVNGDLPELSRKDIQGPGCISTTSTSSSASRQWITPPAGR